MFHILHYVKGWVILFRVVPIDKIFTDIQTGNNHKLTDGENSPANVDFI